VILGIRGDSPFCHTAFHKAHPFPLLSDVHRSVITACGVSVVVLHSAEPNERRESAKQQVTRKGKAGVQPNKEMHLTRSAHGQTKRGPRR
jgi:hypothetical protein